MLAPGVSEDVNDPTLYFNHMNAWRAGTMYRARLTRGLFVETAVTSLTY
jgi:hypothetical protein